MRKCRPAVALVAAALLIGGCSAEISGAAKPEAIIAVADVRPLLLDTADFPPQYPAVVLPQQVASQAAEDMSGLPMRAEQIEPADCIPPTPPTAPDALAVAVGTNEEDRSTLTLLVEDVGSASMSDLRDVTTRCTDVSARNRLAEISVHTEILQTPPEAKDAEIVWRRAVRSGTANSAMHETMVTMAAQVGEVRIFVTYLTFGIANPDFAAMGKLLTSQIQKIRHS